MKSLTRHSANTGGRAAPETPLLLQSRLPAEDAEWIFLKKKKILRELRGDPEPHLLRLRPEEQRLSLGQMRAAQPGGFWSCSARAAATALIVPGSRRAGSHLPALCAGASAWLVWFSYTVAPGIIRSLAILPHFIS